MGEQEGEGKVWARSWEGQCRLAPYFEGFYLLILIFKNLMIDVYFETLYFIFIDLEREGKRNVNFVVPLI